MDREGSIQQLIPQSFHDNTQFFIGRLTTKWFYPRVVKKNIVKIVVLRIVELQSDIKGNNKLGRAINWFDSGNQMS